MLDAEKRTLKMVYEPKGVMIGRMHKKYGEIRNTMFKLISFPDGECALEMAFTI